MRGLLVALLITGCSFELPGAAPPGADAVPADAPPGAPPPFALTGPRWMLPCMPGPTGNRDLCQCPAGVIAQVLQIGGTPGERWHVTARIRGVMEAMTYTGGMVDGTWYAGGSPSDRNWNIYSVTISVPAQSYFLNPGSQLVHYSEAFDYIETFDVDAGALVRFELNGQDALQWRGIDQNRVVIMLAGVTEPEQPFDGQFARIDVTEAVAF